MAISFCAPDERAYLKDIVRLTKQDVPVMETDFSLATPKPEERAPKPRPQGQKQQRPQRGRGGANAGQPERKARRDGEGHAKSGDARKPQRKRDEGGSRHEGRDIGARDNGDRRDRKGNSVWSNSGPAPAYRKQRKPKRG